VESFDLKLGVNGWGERPIMICKSTSQRFSNFPLRGRLDE